MFLSSEILGRIKDVGSPKDPWLDAIDKRRKEIEQKYNCKIVGEKQDPGISFLQPLIMSGEKVADVMEMGATQFLPAAAMGYLTPWDDVKNFNMDAPQFVEQYKQVGTYNGKVYGISYLMPPVLRACLFYNKTLLQRYGLTDPNQLMKENRWTFEEFRKLCLAATKDTNSDNVIDTWGLNYFYNYQSIMYFISANDARMASQNAEGKVTTAFHEPKMLEALQFYYNLMNVDKVIQIHPEDSPDTSLAAKPADSFIQDFVEGGSLFLVGDGWMATQYLADMEDDWGLLPLPMGPSANAYVSNASHGNVFCLTSTNKDLDKTAFIWNLFTAPLEGYEKDWWKEELKDIYRDEASLLNYETILNSMRVDLGYGQPTLLNDFFMTIGGTIYKNQKAPAAALDAIKGLYQDVLDSTYNQK